EGVINLRGKIVSVIDLRKRFGEQRVALARRNRILVLEHKGRLSGFIVDSASVLIQEGGLNCVTGLGKYKGRLIVLLDMAKLLEFDGAPQGGMNASGGRMRKRAAQPPEK